jgi:hypothetical protein
VVPKRPPKPPLEKNDKERTTEDVMKIIEGIDEFPPLVEMMATINQINALHIPIPTCYDEYFKMPHFTKRLTDLISEFVDSDVRYRIKRARLVADIHALFRINALSIVTPYGTIPEENKSQ